MSEPVQVLIVEGLRAGALGYLLKDVSGEELATAVKAKTSGWI